MKVLISTHMIADVDSMEEAEEVRARAHQNALLQFDHQLEMAGASKADIAPYFVYLGTAIVQVPDLELEPLS